MSFDKYDVTVIGGGAAGLCAAIRIKQLLPRASVAVLEQLQRVGKKLIVTGNGRCNITNRDEGLYRFHSENPDFFEYALEKYDNEVIEHFFEGLGVVFTYDETGRAYPYSLQASSVVDALRFAAEDLKIDIKTDFQVSDIKNEKGRYLCVGSGENISCNAVIIAAGLYSGGNKLGSNGSVLRLLKQKGYKTVKTTPAIVQLKTKTDVVRSLKGIKVNAEARLIENSKTVRSEYGEVLFCEYGLSGPPIMQISREVERRSSNFFVSLDLMPDYSFSQLAEMLRVRFSSLCGRSFEEFFTGLLNKRVGQCLIKLWGRSLSDKMGQVAASEIKRLTALIKSFTFEITGTTGFENSQVTAGGLDTHGFNRENMMSYKDKGLFAAGEILDVDGDCGGFNLHWSWSSGMCAADGVIKYLETRNDTYK